MIVDDDADFAKVIRNIATGVGIEVKATNDPKDFSNLYSIDVDIVVLDVFMPEIDGVELLRYLYDNRSDAGVILVSGKDTHVLRSVHIGTGFKRIGLFSKTIPHPGI